MSSPTECTLLDRIEEAVSSDLPVDMMELSICSNFSSTANTGIAHHMNVEQQSKITGTSTLTADTGGIVAEREEVDSEGGAALRHFTVGVIDKATLEKKNTAFPSKPANLTSDVRERAEASRYPDVLTEDAVKISPDLSKSAKGNLDDLQLILPEPSRDLGFDEATLRDEATHPTFAVLPTFDRVSLETRRIVVVYPQPKWKPKWSCEVFCSCCFCWYCCACRSGPYLAATNPACATFDCAHKRCSQCDSKGLGSKR